MKNLNTQAKATARFSRDKAKVAASTNAQVVKTHQLNLNALAQSRDARQKTSFVSAVSHELKTPLTSILQF